MYYFPCKERYNTRGTILAASVPTLIHKQQLHIVIGDRAYLCCYTVLQ